MCNREPLPVAQASSGSSQRRLPRAYHLRMARTHPLSPICYSLFLRARHSSNSEALRLRRRLAHARVSTVRAARFPQFRARRARGVLVAVLHLRLAHPASTVHSCPRPTRCRARRGQRAPVAVRRRASAFLARSLPADSRPQSARPARPVSTVSHRRRTAQCPARLAAHVRLARQSFAALLAPLRRPVLQAARLAQMAFSAAQRQQTAQRRALRASPAPVAALRPPLV